MDQTTATLYMNNRPLEISLHQRIASKDLLFFFHGLGCSKESFIEVWNREDYKHLSLLAVDLAGFGDSARPEWFSYSMEDQARLCEGLLERFHGYRLHLVAHSMGCAVALLLSDEILDSALSFACIEGNLVGNDCGLISRRTIKVPFAEFNNRHFPRFKSQYLNENDSLTALARSDPSGFYRSAESLVEWSDSGRLLDRFKALPCKKEYFYGDQDTAMEVLHELEGIKKTKISRSGHFVMNDNPDEFYTKLLDFLGL